MTISHQANSGNSAVHSSGNENDKRCLIIKIVRLRKLFTKSSEIPRKILGATMVHTPYSVRETVPISVFLTFQKKDNHKDLLGK